jgi:hypothetical protein
MAGGVSVQMSVTGLKELIGRLHGAWSWAHNLFADAMGRSLDSLQENVPPYAPERAGQTYQRTERLGRSLGSGFGGGASSGKPDIFEVSISGNAVEGRFGTRVGYAEYVIGEGTQAWMHAGRWWTVKKIVNSAMKTISGIWSAVGERIGAYILGRK